MVDAALQVCGVDVDDQTGAVVEGHRQRLGPAHAAAARRQREGARERAAEAFGGHGAERLVGALHDALGADVDPRAGGHLTVHGQPQLLQASKFGPRGPVADEVGVGDEHPRRPLVGAHDADRPARLHEHRLVVAERGQSAHEGVEAGPVPSRPAGAAVDHEGIGVLGVLRIEVVGEHAHGGLLRPAERGAGAAAGCADGDRGAEVVGHCGGSSRAGCWVPG